MVLSSLAYSSQTDEFLIAGLEPAASNVVAVPRIGEARISMECRLRTVLQPGSDTVVIGEIVCYVIDDDLIDADGRIDIDRVRPLARLAGRYATLSPSFAIDVEYPEGIDRA